MHPIKLKMSSARYRDDPWSAFRELRDMGPVIRVKIPFFGKCWAATTYESVEQVFKQSEHFVRDSKNAGRKTIIPMQWMLPRVFNSLIQNMLTADGQRHRRLRSVVDLAFARQNIEGMAKQIERIAIAQVDECEKIIAIDGKVDLIEHFARPFPLTVICELLGLPLEDRSKFRKWFEPFSTVQSVFGIFRVGSGMRQIVRYLREQIEIVRKSPRDGLMSELVAASHEGERLTNDELLSLIFLLLVAGHETTVHLLSNTILTLLEHPKAKLELLDDWQLMDKVTEEVQRYCSPLQAGKPRYVAHDMEFHGQQLQQREMIIPLVAAANYDPARFENPDVFNIHRDRVYHMTFGSGPHVCLGMKLARSENYFGVKALFERWPGMRPAFDLAQLDWSKRMMTRGMNSF